MVKPDVKHNYYADLELPITASCDDIRKAYRKLALQYHPDRNAGREGEVLPKFQAIQCASEVLLDPAAKEKYDNDRRKAALYSPFTTAPMRSATPNNPYATNSAYPPPPRRTQPGTWQRPSAAGPPPPPPPNAPANGAERFSNFPRPSARKDPAQDRTNVFRAWQNMNSADRPQQPSQFNRPSAQPPPQPTFSKPRPAPPPRATQEEPMRPGQKYKAPPPFDPDGVDKRSSAWSAYQAANPTKPGMTRSNTSRTPSKHGFDPYAPGSDEKPASGRQYTHSHSAEDFSRAGFTARATAPTSDPRSEAEHLSPTSPGGRRQCSGQASEDVPFTEHLRDRTPYATTPTGESPESQREGLRRSHSVRDTSRLAPDDDGATRARARSSSPHRPNREQTRRGQSFELKSSSEASDADDAGTAEGLDGSSPPGHRRRGSAPHAHSASDRPKKVPTGPSRRFANGAQSDAEQQRSKPKMYEHPSSFSFASSFIDQRTGTTPMLGFHSTLRARYQRRERSQIPRWAIPSSLNPDLRYDQASSRHNLLRNKEYVTGADPLFINATADERRAYGNLREELLNDYGGVPDNLDMDVFLKLVEKLRRRESSGDTALDRILRVVLSRFQSFTFAQYHPADHDFSASSFAYEHNPELYTSNDAKSRSEENINTAFSPEGWKGTFVGEPDYFAPPSGVGKRQPPPARRPSPKKTASSQQRSATLDVPPPGATTARYGEVPQRAWGSDGTPNQFPRTPTGTDPGFDPEEWQKQFQDPTWSYPAPPPGPPSPGKTSAGVRKQSQTKRAARANGTKGAGTRAQPHILDDDDTVEVQGADGQPEHGARIDDFDAMDIDNSPPAQQKGDQISGEAAEEQEARVYSQPPSEWRRQQEQKQRSNRESSIASKRSQRGAANQAAPAFNPNFDDLRNVEPLVQASDTQGSINVADLGASLPFQSQASNTVFGDAVLPRDLILPPLPRAPAEPQRLSKASWHNFARQYGEYIKEFHAYNSALLQHLQERERQAQAQISTGMGWLEATGDTSGMLTAPTGFGTYMRGVKEDKKVRETYMLAWEKHEAAVLAFEKIRDRVRKLVVGGMLVEN